ncbi:hypothetical protein LBWT_X4340 (plasmid) [Leptolyngbya boryana IAM M-101]|nr:hypothetical protein LBWT_X4340 [Leptolyngbya boryana IAM M-101]BAS66710.1 hypothetical protein LBDG_X4340 [Leptolyngbya boryana dg5]
MLFITAVLLVLLHNRFIAQACPSHSVSIACRFGPKPPR